MIDDPYAFGREAGEVPYEVTATLEEGFFLDGPVTRRVAVLDFDPATGALASGARYVPPKPGRKFGGYQTSDPVDIHSGPFIQVSAFATVLETMAMFEEPDALGRPLTWAFEAPQLLVVPRAGEWANAFYERESHSLQFFFITPAEEGKPAVYASLSRDIVAHETAHAILDGIVPTLYNSITPQSLGLHEAIADLTALLISFRSRKLRESVLDRTGGNLNDSTAFSAVAQEFALARDPGSKPKYLRNLFNHKTLDPNDTSLDADGHPNRIVRFEPHALSEVMSGALYAVFVRIYDSLKTTPGWSTGKALFVAGDRLKRMALRTLDYLPPGEVSFADYGRAVLAADQAGHPKDGEVRDWLKEEFVRRAMAASGDLEVRTNFDYPPLAVYDLQALLEQDWSAYEFANRNREFLGIPADASFHVYPRLDTTKLYYRKKESDEREQIRELIFKASWDAGEPSGLAAPFPPDRRIRLGTTMAIDWETRQVRALLTTRPTAEQRADRDTLLRTMIEDGTLRLGDEALGPDGKPLCAAIRAETLDGILRVRGAARMLHVTEGPLDTRATGGDRPPEGAILPLPPPGIDAGAFYDLVEFRRRGYGDNGPQFPA
ncbi:MAG: hypothetical protein ACJ76N_28335 [Thermoanaerobaculia bacterium]